MSKTEFPIFISKTALLVGFSISVSASIKFPICQAHTLGIIFHASHTLSQQILALLLRKYTQYVFNLFLPLLLLPPVSNHHYLLPEIWQVSFAGLFLQSFSFIACYQRWKMSFTVFSSIFHFLIFIVFFLHYHLVPLYPLISGNHHTVVCVHESFFFLAQSLHPLSNFPTQLSSALLWVWPIFLASAVCSLDSTYEWNQTVFVFLWLAYFT